jgi:GDPmannose 4,6-dehydratase
VGKTALITGISGQDGAYLARALLARGYRVVGAFRRTSGTSIGRLEELGISGDVELVDMELLEESNLRHVLNKLKPDEIYNLAAQSFVAKAQETPQNEKTPFYPRSPYGVAKLFAHWSVVNYREAHGLYACSGILFNHESPLRGRDFVTRKVTFGLARVALGQEEMVHIGNLEARRDWGFAGEYVEGMWMMLQQAKPGDYVLATGRSSSVRDFIDGAAAGLGFDIEWTGNGIDPSGRPAERPHHRRRRSKTLPACRGRCAHRRCAESQGRAWLGSKDQPRRPHPDDGQGRLRPREVRNHPLLSRGWRRRRAYRFPIAPRR